MELDKDFAKMAETYGTDFFGVADLSLAYDAILEQGGKVTADFPRAISIGIALFDSIVDQLPQREERAVAVSYKHHCYDVINQRLDLIVSRLSSELVSEGHQALPVPASRVVDDENLLAVFSNKMAAHLAGLGWIGKSCLLITPEKGPRVRWATVLTDAPLNPTGESMAEQCGNCEQCVKICPAQAFTGRPFQENEPREARFDVHKCKDYFNQMEEQGSLAVCGMCLYICPIGRK
jgi:epoxyqueuosine reductase QueG